MGGGLIKASAKACISAVDRCIVESVLNLESDANELLPIDDFHVLFDFLSIHVALCWIL